MEETDLEKNDKRAVFSKALKKKHPLTHAACLQGCTGYICTYGVDNNAGMLERETLYPIRAIAVCCVSLSEQHHTHQAPNTNLPCYGGPGEGRRLAGGAAAVAVHGGREGLEVHRRRFSGGGTGRWRLPH